MNTRITDEYRELNRELHSRTTEEYGNFGAQHFQRVIQIMTENNFLSILDYGCGKGSLKRALGISEMAEYDPAIEGKDAEPEPAELVVCTDVLEHIEPECLDAVLLHIKNLTRRGVFFVIATRPAKKFLLDGRNAHLIIENAEWWKNKLEEYFKLDFFEKKGSNEFHVLCSVPFKSVGKISSKGAVADDLRYKQAKINIKIVPRSPETRIEDLILPHVGHVLLCAYGPSLTKTYESIKKERDIYINSKIVSVSGAHDFLIKKDIIPDYHIEIDPRIHKADFTKNPHPDVHYLIGSCCHPKLIQNLVDHGVKVTLFHVYAGEQDLEIMNELEPGTALLAGGGSVGLRAFNLMFALGFRSFSIRGVDSSYDNKLGGQHAGAHSGKVHSEIDVQCGDKLFRSSYIMIAYARYFISTLRELRQICKLNGEEPINDHGDQIHVVIHGDGLLPAMITELVAGRGTDSEGELVINTKTHGKAA